MGGAMNISLGNVRTRTGARYLLMTGICLLLGLQNIVAKSQDDRPENLGEDLVSQGFPGATRSSDISTGTSSSAPSSVGELSPESNLTINNSTTISSDCTLVLFRLAQQADMQALHKELKKCGKLQEQREELGQAHTYAVKEGDAQAAQLLAVEHYQVGQPWYRQGWAGPFATHMAVMAGSFSLAVWLWWQDIASR